MTLSLPTTELIREEGEKNGKEEDSGKKTDGIVVLKIISNYMSNVRIIIN